MTLAKAQPILEAREVTRTFRSGRRCITALASVNLAIFHDGVVGLIGPDGAGKTTFMRLAAGLLRPDSGEIRIQGVSTRDQALTIQSRIGYMPQRFGLYTDLTVRENLDLYADLQGVAPARRSARYDALMQMTGLGAFQRRLAGKLSGGMKQKLGLACTLVQPKELLLLDEPTVGVDPVSRRELWQIIDRLVEQEQITVLLSTAYMDEAERCRYVFVLNNGCVLSHGEPQALCSRMQGHGYAASAPGMHRRALQGHLVRAPGVLDAVIEREWLRVVTEPTLTPERLKGRAGVPGLELNPLPARFEDAFIAEFRAVSSRWRTTVSGWTPLQPDGGLETVIQVNALERRFGDFQAVRDLSFEVYRGEIFGLLGANGAGKSTTFRMLCGLLPPSSGELSVGGVDLRRASAAARARIGYVSQSFALYGQLTVTQNLRFFANIYNLRGGRRRERIDWALDGFELRALANVDAEDLSLGFKQRLALATALLHQPEILFLDEPTSGVDPLARREFWELINALAEYGVTVLVTTHFMEEADYCDRLVIMAGGQLLALGTPESIKRQVAGGRSELPSMEEAFITLVESPQEELR
ncbi:ATP-binding cassette domain-containing protein [Nitrococcus mobilis]|uniref:Probable ABC transporter ATP-binding protein n=1 Tax=Nitrococcus mobilis Nb-231 TaxID=314278 RepID=A4BQF6_9GAMM|nr:ATP-binding cassette domain-containing protein [Nitrococcus mobilis]EAR21806.1 probable ABC transporter ATP-binding protein [Nitrococcus mobilis Nb-231]